MIAYLDTQLVVWLCQADVAKISRAAVAAIETSELLVSPMVLLEVQYLFELKKLCEQPPALLGQLRSALALRVCDHAFPAVVETALQETWTRDPFDRVIVARAKSNGYAPLISSDTKIRRHYAEAVW